MTSKIMMCLQSVECAEKVMRQLVILYRNARKLLKSNIDVGGTTKGTGDSLGPMRKVGL